MRWRLARAGVGSVGRTHACSAACARAHATNFCTNGRLEVQRFRDATGQEVAALEAAKSARGTLESRTMAQAELNANLHEQVVLLREQKELAEARAEKSGAEVKKLNAKVWGAWECSRARDAGPHRARPRPSHPLTNPAAHRCASSSRRWRLQSARCRRARRCAASCTTPSKS